MRRIQSLRKMLGYMLVPAVLVLFGGVLVSALLVSCGKEPVEPVKGGPITKPETTPDPMEAKKKRLAEIVKEIFDAQEQVKNNPDLRKDPALGEKMKKLMGEGDTLVNELTGGDQSKEDEVISEIIKKYAPKYYAKMEAQRKEAYIVQTDAQIRNIQMALEQYRVQSGSYPSTEDGLKELTRADDPAYPPYLDEGQIKDPWGNPIVYKLVNPNEYMIKSFGPDGKNGTADDIGLEED